VWAESRADFLPTQVDQLTSSGAFFHLSIGLCHSLLYLFYGVCQYAPFLKQKCEIFMTTKMSHFSSLLYVLDPLQRDFDFICDGKTEADTGAEIIGFQIRHSLRHF
jgi:hypothetical protein